MASTTATVGASISIVLAISWVALLAAPVGWIATMNGLYNTEITLMAVKMTQGSFVSGFGMLASFSTSISKYWDPIASVFNQNLSLDDATQRFCAPGVNTLFQWCSEWQMLRIASYATVFLGALTVVFLLLGAGFMYYYSAQHATHTGRMWIRASFIAAPLCALTGVATYTVCSMDIGQHKGNAALGALLVLTTNTSTYGFGFFMAWTLVLLTFVPIFIQAVFGRVAGNEKDGDEEEPPNYGAISFQAVQGAPQQQQQQGYPGYAAGQGYGGQPQLMQPAYQAPYGAMQGGQGGQAPGMGGAAW